MTNKRFKLNKNFIENKIAHRGLHSSTVSENSLDAFNLAIKNNYAIELDIHLLKDGELVVIHDSFLKRVTGDNVNVKDLTSLDLKDHPLLIDGQIIPLLKDVLNLIDGKVPLLIELKFPHKFNHNECDALLKLLENYKYKDMVALQSFHPWAVKYLKEHTNEYSIGFLCSYNLGKRPKLQTYILKSLRLFNYIKADFISYDINYLPNKYVLKKKKKGIQVLSWTVNTLEKLSRAKQYADNVIFEQIIPD